VQSIEGDEVLVDDITSSSSPPVAIWMMDMQKYFVIGDNVCVMSGPEIGLNGWCVKVENGAVQLSEHGTYREVSSLHFMGRSIPKVLTFPVMGNTRTPSVAAACALALETATPPP